VETRWPAAASELWSRFHLPGSDLVYDIPLTSPDQLPTAEEVAECAPNCSGWGTGMEDCALNGGFLLDGLVAEHGATASADSASRARKVFCGLVDLATVSGTRGFVGRGFAPGSSTVYPNSSADQFTAFVFGVWRYARSSIATPAERDAAAGLLADVADLVLASSDNIPRSDLRPSIFGNTSSVTPDRACRLLQIYSAASDLTADERWQRHYDDRLESQGRARARCYYGPDPWSADRPVYPVLQNQAAFHQLFQMESRPEIRGLFARALRDQAASVSPLIACWKDAPRPPAPRAFPGRWREVWASYAESHRGYDPSCLDDVNGFLAALRSDADARVPAGDVGRPPLRQAVEALAVAMLSEVPELRESTAAAAQSMLCAVQWARVERADVWAAMEVGYWRGVQAGVFTCPAEPDAGANVP